MFLRFVNACYIYRFTFALSTYNGFTLILRPNDTFENIEIKEKFYNLFTFYKVFSKAIKEMKEYRKK